MAADGAGSGGSPNLFEAVGGEEGVLRLAHAWHEEMDRRAIACFDQALDDVGLVHGDLRRVLHDYFTWATTTTMGAYPDDEGDVPDDLALPRWSWDGLVE